MHIPENIQSFIDKQADEAPAKYDDLRAVVFNGTLKRSPEPSQLAVGGCFRTEGAHPVATVSPR
jgi:hypothetical protein